ncbi:hypothetical protein, partial [Pseudomonas syringae group genomosp. 7]|uniref:hypothetical protein n=1 Tax=Pseudomonas syringae group genomosp. 7 TaxID=251699 RepID=UPI00376F90FF
MVVVVVWGGGLLGVGCCVEVMSVFGLLNLLLWLVVGVLVLVFGGLCGFVVFWCGVWFLFVVFGLLRGVWLCFFCVGVVRVLVFLFFVVCCFGWWVGCCLFVLVLLVGGCGCCFWVGWWGCCWVWVVLCLVFLFLVLLCGFGGDGWGWLAWCGGVGCGFVGLGLFVGGVG